MVKRYISDIGLIGSAVDDGWVVSYADYVILKAENERLKGEVVDLDEFSEAVYHWRNDLLSDYAEGLMDDGGASMSKADRLLSMINGQKNASRMTGISNGEVE